MNPLVDEVLLSDVAIDELGIVSISFGRGLWRHKVDTPRPLGVALSPSTGPRAASPAS